MDKDLIEIRLSEYSSDIYSCILKGFTRAYSHTKSIGHILTSTSKANITRDFIIDEAKTTFPMSSIINGKGNIILVKMDCFLIRFKKLGKKLLAGNIQTSQAVKFSNQLSLPDIPSSINLNAGYVLDETRTEIKHIYITCPSSLYTNNWCLNLAEFIENKFKIKNPPLVEWSIEQEQLQIKVTPEAKAKRT